jgi:transcriptional regulator with XRE-family HTH domain
MAAEDFSLKLELALKALSISAGGLASELGVDKSVISRWLRGSNRPTGHNLSRLTSLIIGRRAGFSMLDWDADLPRFAARLGVSEAHSAEVAGTFETPAAPLRLGDCIPARIIEEARLNAAMRGSAYEGFWRSTRPSIEFPGRFMQDLILIRMGARGLLTSRLGVEDMGFKGVSFLTQTQVFGFLSDADTGIFIFTIYNAVLRQRADVMDGLTLTCRRNGGGTPVAARSLMERIGLLSGDAAADDARHDAMTRAHVPLVAEEALPQAVRDHLLSDVGPEAHARGGEMLLTMAFAQSMSRGPRTGDEPFRF